ncbi:homeobox-leucine zipper protein HDG5-like [Durio zibethinus]|uniref:Homeobox-leucine zipper protein HDG5-like n=1 Tax=Durio zibethinus TaxID=66656 RepID=A0A6P5YDX7_DURZI|nr:homeobox-leucine zipper protein HDG5-like [Durio zibethinus]XP_022738573.1 homeobox-leucine zipper protein HDG5-like [Durio zibethinus]
MYGDCQVISSMGGNVVSSETLFSSPIQNPNFNFLPFQPLPPMLPKEENELLLRGKEGMDNGSGSEQVEEKSGNEQESNEQPPKKKRYHRHTARQIQELEAVFKERRHPDNKQRMKLSQELGLRPRQVKFWFQNRRTQMKAQQGRSDNVILRAENESLKNEFYQLQGELIKLACPNCGGPAVTGGVSFEELRTENARLREELEWVSAIASRYIEKPIQTMSAAPAMMPHLDLDMSIDPRHFTEPMVSCAEMMPVPMLPETASYPENNNLILMNEEKTVAMELAMSSLDELVKMCRANEPLWIRNNENGKELLNLEEHARVFHWPLNLKQCSTKFRTEASRDSAVVIMNSVTLVDAFLDANKWTELFPSIVAGAKSVQVISPGVSGTNGCLQLIYAELQVLSPLVPTREAYFLRYCQQLNLDDETYWAIVDFPFHGFHSNLQSSFPLYMRRPSGCLIQDMPNGYSRVTWLEHAEIEKKPVHQLFSHFVYNGMAFGAHRWLAVLERQCERNGSLMARNITDLRVIPSPEARKNLMRLAQRMIRTFCVNISTSSGRLWTALPDSSDDTVRISTKKVTEPGQPNGLILSAVSTTWLPYPHYEVFDLLRDESRRAQLEVFSNGNALHKVAHIANGAHPGNCISLLRINVASNSTQHVDLILQESCTDRSGSLVVYSTVDVASVQLEMSGEDPSHIPLLPLGFSITPVELIRDASSNEGKSVPPSEKANGHISGSLLTVGLQILASTIPSANINFSSIAAINNNLCTTVHQIRAALSSNSTPSCPDNGNGVGSCTEGGASAQEK